MSYIQKPPYALIKTWLNIHYSQEIPEHEEAQNVVKRKILKSFGSLYDAEMYLFAVGENNLLIASKN